ncbi:MAG: TIGR03936 family radical SAM-associated protein [Planctomycetota bacterium]|jgi:radical SAM-linked protein|nr:TIGR03936 family radical SAM-associated protein [Planctomycetota bacterium]
MSANCQLIQKSAVRFAKTGAAIYHSHHDMLRFWERLVRRAGLPVRLTQGFNPRPRLVFPHALGLGIVSRLEEVELELHSRLDNREIQRRLSLASPGAVEILEVRGLPPAKGSRQIVASSYRLSGWPGDDSPALGQAAAELMAKPEIQVERGAPGEKRRIDIRPFIKKLALDAGSDSLELAVSHTRTGSARPDEAAKLLAAAINRDWRDWRIEKTGMRLE